MLYTAKPLERVYADPSVFAKKQNSNQKNEISDNSDNKTNMDEYHEVILPNGRIVARKEGKNYVVDKISSTDMKDYLNKDYYPGKNIRK